MPNRKQRRRREKLKRHEYEYVVETEEGEIPVESLRELEENEALAAKRSGRNGRPDTPRDRRGRPIPKPSWRRVFKRAAIFGPILAAFVYLTAGDALSPLGVVLNAAVLLGFFIPFSYLVDVLVYRSVMRRQQRGQPTGQKRR